MLECRIHGAEDLRFAETSIPEPGDGEVLVRLGAAGICGSDIHYYFHGEIGPYVIREPLVPGHEASGVVERTGTGVTRVAPGDRLAINPSRPCRSCSYCISGRENLCSNMLFFGSASVFPHMQGMCREFFLVPEAQCVPVRDEASLEEIAMSEPLSVALHSVQRAGTLVGRKVLITGAGTIGCLLVLAARHAGASRVMVTDVVARPLEVATSVGADETVMMEKGPSGAPARLEGDFDVAFEASGTPTALGTCVESVRRGGVVVQVGTLPAQGFHLFGNLIMNRELELRGSFRFNQVFDLAVQCIATRRIDVRPVISGRFSLKDAVQALHLARDKTVSMKVQLVSP